MNFKADDKVAITSVFVGRIPYIDAFGPINQPTEFVFESVQAALNQGYPIKIHGEVVETAPVDQVDQAAVEAAKQAEEEAKRVEAEAKAKAAAQEKAKAEADAKAEAEAKAKAAAQQKATK